MKERPILFSGPMVRAILDGSKTQTRRIVKPQFFPDAVPAEMSATTSEGWQASGHSGLWWCDAGGCADDAIRCPYGIPCDRLWVRETFGHAWHHAQPSYFYRANDDKDIGRHPDFAGWKPSIHMPRAASRILLEVTGVRVEKLQDISEADAIAEGISVWSRSERHGVKWECPQHVQRHGGGDNVEDVCYDGRPVKDPREAYRGVWSSINGAGSWEANPWVWVIEFKRIQAGATT